MSEATAKVKAPVVRDAAAPDIASVPGIKFPPEPSPAQRAATELRSKLGPVAEVLMKDRVGGLRAMGAALMAYHLAIVEGLEKAATMTEKEVLEWGHSFRSRFPAAWGAASQTNVQGFVRHLKIAELRGGADDLDDKGKPITSESMIVDYQGGMSKIFAG